MKRYILLKIHQDAHRVFSVRKKSRPKISHKQKIVCVMYLGAFLAAYYSRFFLKLFDFNVFIYVSIYPLI